MYFGSARSAKIDTSRFRSTGIKSEPGIDFTYPLCPLCHQKMTQIYSDTAMINQANKWIKIVQCKGGNKVLLTRDVPPRRIQVWFSEK